MAGKDEDPLDPFGVNEPYWKRHYGLRPAHATQRGRRGCVLTLWVALALIAMTLIVAALTR